MSFEITGLIRAKNASDVHDAGGPVVDPRFLEEFARAHEDAGFDRVLIAYSSSEPDGLQLAAYVADRTERLKFMIAQRPGFLNPTVAARVFATLENLHPGRVGIHVISGGRPEDQRRDGDFIDDKGERYARSREYIELIRRSWTATEPFDYEGRHYRVEDFISNVRPTSAIPFFFGGASPAAYDVGGALADVYAIFAGPTASVAEEIAAIRAAASSAGRAEPPEISLSARPILGATEAEAWEHAHELLARVEGHAAARRSSRYGFRGSGAAEATVTAGAQRQLDAAAAGERQGALWLPFVAASGAQGNQAALVGTPETVAAALMEYVDLGVDRLLLHGFDAYRDAVEYGHELIPLLRQEAARRELGAAPGRV